MTHIKEIRYNTMEQGDVPKKEYRSPVLPIATQVQLKNYVSRLKSHDITTIPYYL